MKSYDPISLEQIEMEYVASEIYRMRANLLTQIMKTASLTPKETETLISHQILFAPASVNHHLSELGGLSQHIIDVYLQLKKIQGEKDAARLALFHDICKLDFYEWYIKKDYEPCVPYINPATGKERKTRDYWEIRFRINDTLPVGHGERSIIKLLLWGFTLTESEVVAIRWHMGLLDKAYQYARIEEYGSLTAFPEYRLLQYADQMATNLEEKERLEA